MIARALVSKPRILFFDEATSALDNQTQATVSQSLEALQATRIVQSGTYDALIASEGLFAELARRQLA